MKGAKEKKLYIVTGGAGFIGSALVSKLNSLDQNNIIIVDELGDDEKWKNLQGKVFDDYFHKDRFLKSIVENKAPKKVKALVHLGACSSTTETDVDYLYENNFRYSVHLAEWARKNGIKFIYASSGATYGDGSLGYSDSLPTTLKLTPLNPYGFSKQLFDLWVLKNGYEAKVVGLKFFNVFGPNEYHKGEMRSMVLKAYGQIKERGKVRLFKSYLSAYKDGGQKRDFIYIKDCVEVMSWFLNQTNATGIFNLGSGKARTWNDLTKAVFKALRKKPMIEYIEMPNSIKNQYQYFTQADMSKLKTLKCPVKFHSMEDAIKDYVGRYLEKGEGYL